MPKNTFEDKSVLQIGSGNSVVPSGNKPLPEPMLTETYVTTGRTYVAIGRH